MVFVKGHHNHVRFDFEAGEAAQGFTETDARALVAEYFDPTSCEFLRLAPYDFYAGMPDHWREGRLFLAGLWWWAPMSLTPKESLTNGSASERLRRYWFGRTDTFLMQVKIQIQLLST